VIKEVVTLKDKTTSLSVTNGKVSAVLRSNIQKTGVRLYDSNCLAIAGAIGAYREEELVKKAKQLLKFKLPYDSAPEEGARRSVDFSKKLELSDGAFVELAGNVLEALGKKYPQFMFSHKLELKEVEETLVNDCGTELSYKDRYLQLQLINKHRDSKNLMDGGGAVVSRIADFDKIVESLSLGCDVYSEKADFSEKGEMIPVVMLGNDVEFISKFVTDLKGDVYGSGASLFSEKVGQELFNKDFTLLVNRDAENKMSRFFDGEGVVLKDDCFALIENGVLKSAYTSKRIAKQYGLQVTGSAALVYDSAPDVSSGALAAAQGGKTIKELLGGRKAILAVQAAGGDFTPQGEYASPIQTAYLFDGEKLLGRLPQLSMRSNVYDMFGKDYIGASSDSDYPGSPFNYMAINMNVSKIDGWM